MWTYRKENKYIYVITYWGEMEIKETNKWMKGQSEIAYLPKFANMILIVMMIVITEILYVILIFDCFENQ